MSQSGKNTFKMEIRILFHKSPDLLDHSAELRTLRFHPFLLWVFPFSCRPSGHLADPPGVRKLSLFLKSGKMGRGCLSREPEGQPAPCPVLPSLPEINHILLFAASHSPGPAKYLGCLCLLCSSQHTSGLPDLILHLFPLRLCRFLVCFSSSVPAKSSWHHGTEKLRHTYFTKERTKGREIKGDIGSGRTWKEIRKGWGWKEMSSTSLRLSANRTLINEN